SLAVRNPRSLCERIPSSGRSSHREVISELSRQRCSACLDGSLCRMIIERIHASKINDKIDRTETTHYRISTTLNALVSSRHTEAMARPPSGRPPKRPTKVGVQIAFRISNE